MRLSEEAELAVRELADLRRGRVLIGANEAAVHALLPLIARSASGTRTVQMDVRRVPARQVSIEVLQRTLDFGILTFSPPSGGSRHDRQRRARDPDESGASARQAPAVQHRASGTADGHRPHDPSPARDRVLRQFEQRHEQINIEVSLPSLEASNGRSR